MDLFKKMKKSIRKKQNSDIVEEQAENVFLLAELNEEIQENILEFLSPRDLARLSQTCRAGKNIVKYFICHHLESFERRSKVGELLKSNKIFLNHKLQKYLKSNNLGDTTLTYYAAKLLQPLEVKYFSVIDAEDFPHLNSNYIVQERDPNLGREVVLVQRVCWLKFIKKLGTCTKGVYHARLHLYLGKDVNWPCWDSQDLTTIKVAYISESNHEKRGEKDSIVEEKFSSEYWNEIVNGRFHAVKLERSRFVSDQTHSGWFFFELESFELVEDSEIQFEFFDIQNRSWKRNIRFDQIELAKMTNFK